MSAAEVKRKQAARLASAGHSMAWRRTRGAHLGTCRSCGGQVECGDHGPTWRGGYAGGPPSLLRWMGVNVIRRCPGARR